MEIAARSLSTGCHGELEFERNYLVRIPNSTVEAGEYHGPSDIAEQPPRVLARLLAALSQATGSAGRLPMALRIGADLTEVGTAQTKDSPFLALCPSCALA